MFYNGPLTFSIDHRCRHLSLFVASARTPLATPSMPGATLVRPPPVDPSKSPIETVLELRTLNDIGPVIIEIPR